MAGQSPGAPNRLGVASKKLVVFVGISQANRGSKCGRGLDCHGEHELLSPGSSPGSAVAQSCDLSIPWASLNLSCSTCEMELLGGVGDLRGIPGRWVTSHSPTHLTTRPYSPLNRGKE